MGWKLKMGWRNRENYSQHIVSVWMETGEIEYYIYLGVAILSILRANEVEVKNTCDTDER